MLGALEPPGAEWSTVGVLAGRRTQCAFHPSAWSIQTRICGHVFCALFSPENFFYPLTSAMALCTGGMGLLTDPGKQPWMGEWAVALCWVCCVTLDKRCTSGSLGLM